MTRNANRMQEAVDLLMADFQDNAATIVTYSRGAATISGISVTVGRTPYEVMEGEMLVAYESRDYFVKKADLVASGVELIPAAGDRITEANGHIYEVMVPKPFNVYECIGADNSVLKIHTKGLSL